MGEQSGPSGGAATRGSDLLSLGSFVILGLPDGMLGTAWPSMRATFGAPVGDLGLILLITTVGSVLVTAFVGRLIRRLGVPALLAVAGLWPRWGSPGSRLAPGLWLALSVAALLGVSAGMMDGGLNTAVALTGRTRLLNLLHGAYGVGTAIGPLVVTAAILAGSWRPAYLVRLPWTWSWPRCGCSSGGASRPGRSLRHRPPGPGGAAAAQHPAEWSRRRYRGVVAAGMGVFFVYTGLEVGAGQWEASFCRGHLGLSPTETGLATFGYWGALTAVRISLAVLPRPVPPRSVVTWGSALAVLAAAVIWWQPGAAVTVLGFAVLGGALAGVFPALIALTPVRLGDQRAQDVISWQVGAAAAGRRRNLRPDRAAHRRHQPGRPRPGADRPGHPRAWRPSSSWPGSPPWLTLADLRQLHRHRVHRGGQGHRAGLVVHRARAGVRDVAHERRQLEQHRTRTAGRRTGSA